MSHVADRGDHSIEIGADLVARAAGASDELRRYLDGRLLVCVDRFGSAGRNVYAGPAPVDALRPQVMVSYTEPWVTPGPDTVICDVTTTERDRRRKHDFLAANLDAARDAVTAKGGRPGVLVWYDTPDGRALAGPDGVLLTVPAACRRAVESKCRLGEHLAAAQVPERFRIPAVNLTGDRSETFERLRSTFGSPFVVQEDWSTGGLGTHYVSDEATHRAVVERAEGSPLRVSAFVPGIAGGIAVLSVPSDEGVDVYVDAPSRKGSDIAALGIGSAKGAGNDWTMAMPAIDADAFVEAICALGRSLHETTGLVGMWNVGVMHGPRGPQVNEINGRLAGGTETLALHHLARGEVPALAAHVAVMLGRTPRWLSNPHDYCQTSKRLAAGERRAAPFYLKVRNRTATRLIGGDRYRGAGAYRLIDGRLRHVDDSPNALASRATDAVVLADALALGAGCQPGADLCKLEGITERPVYAGPHALSGWAAELVDAVFDLFEEG